MPILLDENTKKMGSDPLTKIVCNQFQQTTYPQMGEKIASAYQRKEESWGPGTLVTNFSLEAKAPRPQQASLAPPSLTVGVDSGTRRRNTSKILPAESLKTPEIL